MKLKDKNILIGITGSVAIYKIIILITSLKSKGANVKVIMSEAATRFINPLIFSVTSDNKALTEEDSSDYLAHINLGKWADVFLIAPASLNTISKMRVGLADNLLLNTFLAFPLNLKKGKVFIAPAMNTNMWETASNKENIKVLEERGYKILYPEVGILACGDEGIGKLMDIKLIEKEIEAVI